MPRTVHSPFAGDRSKQLMSILIGTVILLLLTSCGPRQTSESGSYRIELLPPDPTTTALFVRLSDEQGQPIIDAQVAVEGNMNHAGMAPVNSGPVTDAASPAADGSDDGAADGVYRVPFQFTMLGDWIITVTAVSNTDPEGKTTRNFDVTVSADGTKIIEP
ncbi:MAG: FixH family protein [Caldilineaceae bacterium]|jgi:hypothetical protein